MNAWKMGFINIKHIDTYFRTINYNSCYLELSYLDLSYLEISLFRTYFLINTGFMVVCIRASDNIVSLAIKTRFVVIKMTIIFCF